MPKLVATQALRYAARELAADEEFDASEADAHVLKTCGRAKDAPVATLPKSEPPQVHTAALKSEDGGDLLGDEGKQRRGRYRRTDMRPEE